jgi:triacylglycerol lipase
MTVPRLRAPIVLVHGLLGFDQVRLGNWVFAQYFRKLPQAFRSAGNRVLVARLSPTGPIAARAAQLKRLLDQQSPHDPVHIFAHSMGGLDARYMIARLGMAERVLSLTTLGTPHRGTAFADWGVGRLGRFLSPLFDLVHVSDQAFRDLTTQACAELNRLTPDSPSVRYFSVAGRHERSWRSLSWRLPGAIVERAEGPNDGLVSLASARYGEACDVWDADHVNLVNWALPVPFAPPSRRHDRLPHYAALLRRLADAGF